MYYDPTFLILIPALLLGLFTQLKLKSTYAKYSRVQASYPGTAAEAADAVLRSGGINTVSIEPIQGQLTDHYDPRSHVLRLSDGVFDSSSVAALGIAAHEAGHAMQQHEHYGPLALRSAAVPVVNIGSNAAIPLFILGLVLSLQPMVWMGIILFSLSLIFALITLPVEFDASRRAVRMLSASGVVSNPAELEGVKKVLNAAAMTYVAAAVTSALQLARMILIANSGRRRD